MKLYHTVLLTALLSSSLTFAANLTELHGLSGQELNARSSIQPDDIETELVLIRHLGRTNAGLALQRWRQLTDKYELNGAQELYYQALGCEIRIRMGDMQAAQPNCATTLSLLSGSHDQPVTEAIAYNALGSLHAREGKPEEALDLFERGLALATESGDAALRVTLLHNRGVALMLYGLTDLAIEAFELANQEHGSLPSDDTLPKVLAYNLGYMSAQKGEHEAALASYETVIPWLEETRQLARTYIAYTQVALSLTALGRHQEALEHLIPWMSRDDITVTPDSEAQAYLVVGQAYLGLGDFDNARSKLTTGIRIARENGNPSRLRELSLVYASMLIELGEFTAARDNLLDLITLLSESGQGLDNALELLADTHAGLGNYRDAFEASKKSAVASRDAQSETFNRRLSNLRVTNQMDLKDQELALARERARAALAGRELDELTRNAAIVAAILILVLIYLIFSRRAEHREASLQRELAERLEQEVKIATHEVELELARRHEAEHTQAALELRLLKDEKLKSIGRLTGGVAHDFNNLMTVILLSAEMLLEDLTGKNQALAQDIIGATNSGQAITRGLLAYARQQPLKPSQVHLHNYLNENFSLFKRTLGESFDLQLDLSPDDPVIEVDVGQLTTCILNLIFNARDASAKQNAVIRVVVANTADTVSISVIDNGCGMTEDEVARAVEPFYSTKAASEGAGLGLSMVYGFVNQSGGELLITSEPGVGTSIVIVFTRVKNIDDVAQAEPPPARTPSGSHVILFVEDEDKIREVSRLALERDGITVIEAEDGEDALARLITLPKLDLLITDLVMPGSLSGLKLMEAARQNFPDLPVILISGYATDVPGDCIFLGKPFSLRELQEAVRKQLGRVAA